MMSYFDSHYGRSCNGSSKSKVTRRCVVMMLPVVFAWRASLCTSFAPSLAGLFCNDRRLAPRHTETFLSKRERQSSSKHYNSKILMRSTPKLKTTQAINSNDDLIWIPESQQQQQQQHTNSTTSSILTSLLTRAKQDISHVADSYSPFSFNKKSSSKLVSASPEWKRLQNHAAEVIQHTHLRDLLKDEQRSNEFYAEHDGVYFDYTRQRVTIETMKLLTQLAQRQNIQQRIKDMMNGEHINFTEDRPVLHTALRASPTQTILVKDEHGVRINAIKEVHDVLFQIQQFAEGVRNGSIRGYTGKRLRNFVSVGIGGSYLGPSFLHECLKTDPEGVTSSLGYSLRFLANIDPVDVERACADLDPEETLILVVSKTFTTSETMLNARTMRQWLWDFMGNDVEVVRKHVVACASISSKQKVEEFGIDTEQYFFRFWDWVSGSFPIANGLAVEAAIFLHECPHRCVLNLFCVPILQRILKMHEKVGGRYSVSSAVGAVPIALQYGFDLFEKFLKGAKSIDDHFATAPILKNIPILMGLIGVWNMSFLGYKGRATLPYAEALLKLPAHIQQLDMESNGKSVTKDNLEIDYDVGEVDFGEPGTNGQHSFYQLLHMGQTIPSDFIGFVQSQHDYCVDGEHLSSHDELMSNFFAQPDALAKGKTPEEVRQEGSTPEWLVPHKTFSGNRPSSSLLLPQLSAYHAGQLLAIFEHRTAVQGFLWDINSFDQWGVELGKKLAVDVKKHIMSGRANLDKSVEMKDNPATSRILNYFIQGGSRGNSVCDDILYPSNGNTITTVTRKTHKEHSPPLGSGKLS